MTSAELPNTYISSEKLEQIRHMATQTWRRRQGVRRVIEAALQEQALSTLVEEFDSAISSLNERWFRNPAINDGHFWNIRALDWYLSARRDELPSLQRSSSPCSPTETRDFVQTLRDMAPLMERVEQDLLGPRLTFAAIGDLSERHALVGGAVQVAGRYVTRQLGEDPERTIQVWRGGSDTVETDLPTVIMDALLEVPIANRQPLHYGYFRAAQEMGWYESGGPFSPAVVLQAANPSIDLLRE